MERQEIFDKLNEIYADVLDLDEVELNETTTADDIEEWDSLTQVQLIVEIQKEFGVKFTSSEMIGWNNVGEMVDTIIGKGV